MRAKDWKMTIGMLASESKTNAQTIRYYEQLSLMPEPRRTDSNYRVYDEQAVLRLEFIRRAKKIGFSLKDIKMLLDLAGGQVQNCKRVREFAESRLEKVKSQISHLVSMERAMADLVRQCKVSDKIDCCAIIDSLSEKY